MPEFAEVNLQVKWLRERVTGWRIDSFGVTAWSHFPELKDAPDKDDLLKRFYEGAEIEAVTQRAKWVVFRLSTGLMISHLMFKGRWSIAGDDFVSNYKQHKNKPTEKSANFWIESEGRRLNFHEPEYKGKVHAFPGETPGGCKELSQLGPEVLITPETDPDFSRDPWEFADLQKSLSKTRKAVKELLLDQKKQAGLGNMYVCEALYRARVRPDRPSNEVSADEAERIHREARDILQRAIDTTLDYAEVLAVYNRETDPDGNPVEVMQVGGRDSYWAPGVQR